MRVGTSFLCNFAVFYLMLSPLQTVALTPCCFYCHTHCTQYKFLSKRVKVKSFLVKSNILAFMRISLLCTHAVSSYFFVQESPVLPVFFLSHSLHRRNSSLSKLWTKKNLIKIHFHQEHSLSPCVCVSFKKQKRLNTLKTEAFPLGLECVFPCFNKDYY